ncbi:MAG: glutathionyl-hydroquinone reductase [Solirubrobacteraceae bacterium]|jgi:putative glutathione S-transferase|nr:glutathionyl-hydroquinone reductase [Solirubrobacteraceae bacterium]
MSQVTRQQSPGPAERGAGGRFNRQASRFRDWVSADGRSGYPAEAGRYHLYVSLACPWAHRTVILRKLKGLEGSIGMSITDPIRDERGWAFRDVRGATGDPLHGWEFLAEAYAASDPSFAGRITVPVLWDRETRRIVNNESADLVVMLNHAFDAVAEHPDRDFYPVDRRPEIDALDEVVYETVNNGVYRAGFAETAEAYEEAVHPLFETLDRLDERLADRRFLLGAEQTLADWRLFPTLVRFDPVYVGHFKCNLRRIVDYPNLGPYLRDLYQTPGVAETVDLDHIKRHYYETHRGINPTGIVPVGPLLDLAAPHDRARFGD